MEYEEVDRLRHKRSYKKISKDSKDHYSGLAENLLDAKAREQFRLPA